jgi:hypothetical protein
MERKTAVAAASAISMSLVTAVVALGASMGALGFAASPTPAANPTPAAVAAPAASTAAATPTPVRTSSERTSGEREGEHRSTPTTTARESAPARGGESE